MVSYISASYIFPVVEAPIKGGVIAVDTDGSILNVLTAQEAEAQHIKDIQHYDGLLVPGFVNTHCHLELSNLKGEIEKHTGLPNFVQSVMKLRISDEHALDMAMLNADIEMFENGIVAVGDISNQIVSKVIKRGSPIYYHTFLETMGFNPVTAKASMARALELKEKFDPFGVSIVPHAPYSVSAELFDEIRLNSEQNIGPISIHNQETADENAFFESKTGGFLELYKFLGLDIEFYKASGKTSLQTILKLLPAQQRILLVHNTFTSIQDVEFAKANHSYLYWCLCPNANLYIENRLPDVNMLRAANLKITLGTDSLASNSGLSIFDEMQTLQNHFEVPVEELMRWGTLNGAEFLGVSDRYGSIETGKRPGINLIGFNEEKGNIVLGNWMKRLF